MLWRWCVSVGRLWRLNGCCIGKEGAVRVMRRYYGGVGAATKVRGFLWRSGNCHGSEWRCYEGVRLEKGKQN